MNTRKRGFDLQGEDDYKKWQDLILAEAGVECSVVVDSHCISIRTKDWADYYLARAVIRQRVAQEVVRDLEELRAVESNSREQDRTLAN